MEKKTWQLLQKQEPTKTRKNIYTCLYVLRALSFFYTCRKVYVKQRTFILQYITYFYFASMIQRTRVKKLIEHMRDLTMMRIKYFFLFLVTIRYGGGWRCSLLYTFFHDENVFFVDCAAPRANVLRYFLKII